MLGSELHLVLLIFIIPACLSSTGNSCSAGDYPSLNCYETKLDEGYKLSYRACECNDCTKPFKGCIGNLGKGGQSVYDCGEGKCVACKTHGETCTDDGECCTAYRYKENLRYTYSSYCDKTTKKCKTCTPTGGLCGTSKTAVQCCSVVNDKNSDVKCQQTASNEYTCTSNICKVTDILVKPGYSCPEYGNGKFCKCGTGKTYGQCTVEGICAKCSVEGGKCSTALDCCQLDGRIRGSGVNRGVDCKNEMCIKCLAYGSRGCSTSSPCCRVDESAIGTDFELDSFVTCQGSGNKATCEYDDDY